MLDYARHHDIYHIVCDYCIWKGHHPNNKLKIPTVLLLRSNKQFFFHKNVRSFFVQEIVN